MTAEAKDIFATWQKHKLFKQALRHRSAGPPHNERLEFIGDAVIGLLIARRLYDIFPAATEGHLTRMRSHLVNGRTLARLAREIGLDERLVLGRSEETSSGRTKTSILAGALEAVVGAVYLLTDLETVNKAVMAIFGDNIESVNKKQLRDSKTRLQERLQAMGQGLPDYQTTKLQGAQSRYEVRCCVGKKVTKGQAGSIKEAGQIAAEQMITRLTNQIARGVVSRTPKKKKQGKKENKAGKS